ncbi:MarR family winged helix-turn-helix transcriptional regulator [Roseibium sp. MMSF_3412]|uniref:MarR family winged helix-turn-helix transcriptional regulator n=1 Tax=Roseibium sp. MMSF_3412 TaxID=3046712 RepID=UPI00273ED2C1|nr:MarR family transcriptional regulator [Roseibium sp. MMSF_3412]
MTEDIVRALGYGTLGSRLKRMGEKLQAQTQEISARSQELNLPASHHPVLAALDRYGPLSVGSLTDAVGLSQPGVTRMVNKLKSDGLVEGSPDPSDRRVARIALTGKGQALVRHLQKTLWPEIILAVADACSGLNGSLLQQLTQLEDALEAQSLRARRSAEPLPDWEDLMSKMENMR